MILGFCCCFFFNLCFIEGCTLLLWVDWIVYELLSVLQFQH